LTSRSLWFVCCPPPLSVLQASWRRRSNRDDEQPRAFMAAHRDQLKPRTSELGQRLRFEGWLEVRPALSWSEGLIAVPLHLLGIIKLKLLCEAHERTPNGAERDKRLFGAAKSEHFNFETCTFMLHAHLASWLAAGARVSRCFRFSCF
jgi:hypothetical protein